MVRVPRKLGLTIFHELNGAPERSFIVIRDDKHAYSTPNIVTNSHRCKLSNKSHRFYRCAYPISGSIVIRDDGHAYSTPNIVTTSRRCKLSNKSYPFYRCAYPISGSTAVRVTYPVADRLTTNAKSYQPQDSISVHHRLHLTFFTSRSSLSSKALPEKTERKLVVTDSD